MFNVSSLQVARNISFQWEESSLKQPVERILSDHFLSSVQRWARSLSGEEREGAGSASGSSSKNLTVVGDITLGLLAGGHQVLEVGLVEVEELSLELDSLVLIGGEDVSEGLLVLSVGVLLLVQSLGWVELLQISKDSLNLFELDGSSEVALLGSLNSRLGLLLLKLDLGSLAEGNTPLKKRGEATELNTIIVAAIPKLLGSLKVWELGIDHISSSLSHLLSSDLGEEVSWHLEEELDIDVGGGHLVAHHSDEWLNSLDQSLWVLGVEDLVDLLDHVLGQILSEVLDSVLVWVALAISITLVSEVSLSSLEDGLLLVNSLSGSDSLSLKLLDHGLEVSLLLLDSVLGTFELGAEWNRLLVVGSLESGSIEDLSLSETSLLHENLDELILGLLFKLGSH